MMGLDVCLYRYVKVVSKTNIKPNNTIRAQIFYEYEFGLRGGLKYAEIAVKENEQHIAAISDIIMDMFQEVWFFW